MYKLLLLTILLGSAHMAHSQQMGFASSIAVNMLSDSSTKLSMQLFPMPATTKITVSYNVNNVYFANVYSLVGRKLKEYSIPAANGNSFTIPTDALQDGIYLIELLDAQHHSLGLSRFIKQ
jgi:hypothetical protein